MKVLNKEELNKVVGGMETPAVCVQPNGPTAPLPSSGLDSATGGSVSTSGLDTNNGGIASGVIMGTTTVQSGCVKVVFEGKVIVRN